MREAVRRPDDKGVERCVAVEVEGSRLDRSRSRGNRRQRHCARFWRFRCLRVGGGVDRQRGCIDTDREGDRERRAMCRERSGCHEIHEVSADPRADELVRHLDLERLAAECLATGAAEPRAVGRWSKGLLELVGDRAPERNRGGAVDVSSHTGRRDGSRVRGSG